MKCELCGEVCRNDDDYSGHLMVDHKMEPHMSLRMAEKVLHENKGIWPADDTEPET